MIQRDLKEGVYPFGGEGQRVVYSVRTLDHAACFALGNSFALLFSEFLCYELIIVH